MSYPQQPYPQQPYPQQPYPQQPYPQQPYPQQQSYPAAGYQPPPRPAPKTSTGGPKVMFLIGLVIVVLSTAGGIAGIFMAKSGVDSLTQLANLNTDVDVASVRTIDAGVPTTVELGANTAYVMWIGDDTYSASAGSAPSVTGPDGPVTVDRKSYTPFGVTVYGWTFQTGPAGSYEITTSSTSPSAQLLPDGALETLIDGMDAWNGLGAIGLGATIIVVTVGLGAIGLGLFIGGWGWWASRAKKKRRLAAAT
ncbi:MAG: hypothetical protein FWF02_06540 [Micrococcales bacterium]|nr:hypothetical protein [Micrococcales bacterium]MCL2667349.1 hypothetical protein [Micrococcales bacterium]